MITTGGLASIITDDDLRGITSNPAIFDKAITSTKNPNYPELLYVETLIGPRTVNTMPPATYEAFREYGSVARTLEVEVAEAKAQVAALGQVGIDLKTVTDRLEEEGPRSANSRLLLLRHAANSAFHSA